MKKKMLMERNWEDDEENEDNDEDSAQMFDYKNSPEDRRYRPEAAYKSLYAKSSYRLNRKKAKKNLAVPK